MSFTNLMSTFQYGSPRIMPAPPVPLSIPRIGARRVLSKPAGSAKMLKAPGPALLCSEADPPEYAFVKTQFSFVKKLAPSPEPKDWPSVFVPQPIGAPLPIARIGDNDQPPAIWPMMPCWP